MNIWCSLRVLCGNWSLQHREPLANLLWAETKCCHLSLLVQSDCIAMLWWNDWEIADVKDIVGLKPKPFGSMWGLPFCPRAAQCHMLLAKQASVVSLHKKIVGSGSLEYEDLGRYKCTTEGVQKCQGAVLQIWILNRGHCLRSWVDKRSHSAALKNRKFPTASWPVSILDV